MVSAYTVPDHRIITFASANIDLCLALAENGSARGACIMVSSPTSYSSSPSASTKASSISASSLVLPSNGKLVPRSGSGSCANVSRADQSAAIWCSIESTAPEMIGTRGCARLLIEPFLMRLRSHRSRSTNWIWMAVIV